MLNVYAGSAPTAGIKTSANDIVRESAHSLEVAAFPNVSLSIVSRRFNLTSVTLPLPCIEKLPMTSPAARTSASNSSVVVPLPISMISAALYSTNDTADEFAHLVDVAALPVVFALIVDFSRSGTLLTAASPRIEKLPVTSLVLVPPNVTVLELAQRSVVAELPVISLDIIAGSKLSSIVRFAPDILPAVSSIRNRAVPFLISNLVCDALVPVVQVKTSLRLYVVSAAVALLIRKSPFNLTSVLSVIMSAALPGVASITSMYNVPVAEMSPVRTRFPVLISESPIVTVLPNAVMI